MALTPKPVALLNGEYTKEELEARKEQEEKLKGSDDEVYKIPKCFKGKDKKIERDLYKKITDNLKSADILNNLDVEIIIQAVNCIIHMHNAEEHIRQYGEVVLKPDGTFQKNPSVNIFKDYQSMYMSISIRLGLSPSDRAKISIINVQQQQKEEDPLLKILGDDDD